MRYIILLFTLIGTLIYASLMQSFTAFFLFIMCVFLGYTMVKKDFEKPYPKHKEVKYKARELNSTKHPTSKPKAVKREDDDTLFHSALGASMLTTLDDDESTNTSQTSAIDDGNGLIEGSSFSAIEETVVNPASGLPMVGGMGGLDAEGNPYGVDNHDHFIDNNHDSCTSFTNDDFSSGCDFDTSSSFDSFNDDF